MTLEQRLTALVVAVRTKLNLMTPRLLPTGGAVGQILYKSGAADGASAWSTPTLTAPKTATLTIPYPGAYEYSQAVTDASLTGAEQLMVWLAPAADDSDENDPEMIDLVTLVADAAAGSVTFTITFSEITSGDIRVLYRNPASL